MNGASGLRRRVEKLERAAVDQYVTHHEIGAALMQKVFDLADRYRLRPAPPIEQQSAGERCIRAALEAAVGADGHEEYAARFWATFVTQMRRYIQEHETLSGASASAVIEL